MHKDQTFITETVLKRLTEKSCSDLPQDVRDCTVLLRMLVSGPDPLYLMETCPESFTRLCRNWGFAENLGRAGIEAAHWQGPGVLLAGTGYPLNGDLDSAQVESTDIFKIKQEGLWILMASCSICTENGYKDDITERERIAVAQRAAVKLYELSMWDGMQLRAIVTRELEQMQKNISFTTDERGFPHTTDDLGFYLGYKLGHKIVACETPTMTFWGTTPDTTRFGQGVMVDKQISPCFGIVFKPKEDANVE